MASDALLIGLVSLDRRAIGSGLEGMPVQAHGPEWRPGAVVLDGLFWMGGIGWAVSEGRYRMGGMGWSS